jgi:hypothetical protein
MYISYLARILCFGIYGNKKNLIYDNNKKILQKHANLAATNLFLICKQVNVFKLCNRYFL